jgi:hypothetical protein
MGKRLDWERAKRSEKPVRSIKDENEWRAQDRAAKWLDRVENGHPRKGRLNGRRMSPVR